MTLQGNLGLGIDAGGTQTRWALSQPDGSIVAQGHVAGLTGLLVENAEGRARLQVTMDALAAAVLPHARPSAVVAGITGLSEDSTKRQTFREMLARPLGLSADDISLRADVEIAYLDVFAPGEGYLVYAGTGSIAAFIDAANVFHRAGGRGVVLDDAGGGYWIAREALRHVWRAEDERPGCSAQSPLALALGERLGGTDWLSTRNFVYGASHADTRGDIGKLALAVAATVESDPVSRDIIERAGGELARLANAMLARFGTRPVALAGRAVELHPLMVSSMQRGLPSGTTFKACQTEAAVAAAHIAAKSLRTGRS